MEICPFCLNWFWYPVYCITPSDKEYWTTPRCPICHEELIPKTSDKTIQTYVKKLDKLTELLEKHIKLLTDNNKKD